MATKFYVDGDGNYIGGYEGTTGKDLSAYTEVPSSPLSALDVWDGAAWGPSLAVAKENKIISLYGSYIAARTADVSFTTAGAVTKDFQADEESVYAIQGMLDTYPVTTPTDFYWRSSDNTNVTPFTRADLAGLAFTIGDRAWGYFQNLTDKKDAVIAATTVAAVNAITW